jgi:hypothetical protein
MKKPLKLRRAKTATVFNILFCLAFQVIHVVIATSDTISSPPTVMPASYTTIPDKFNWNSTLQTTTANKLILKTTIQNGPTQAANPWAMLALGDMSHDAPAYTINIAYQSNNTKYVISVIKRNQGFMTQILNIDASSNLAAWNYLETWRTGTPQRFTLNYTNGMMLLIADSFVLWSWQDSDAIDGITRATVASSAMPLIYTNTTVSSSITSLAPNTIEFLPMNNQTTLYTFQTNDAVPQTITFKLYTDPTTFARYELVFDSSNGCYTKLIQRTTPTSSDILTSTGSYEINAPAIPATTQTYFLNYSSALGGPTITFGLYTDSNNTTTLLSWTGSQGNNAAISLCSLACSSQLTNITNSAIMVRASNIPPLGLNKKGTTYTASGLAYSAAYVKGSTTWDSFCTLPQTDAGSIRCDIQLSNSQSIAANGAVFLFGTQPQGQPLYGITIEPDSDAGRLFNSSSTRARFRVFTFTQGVMQYLANEVTVDGHQIGGTYRINYEKGTGPDATISIETINNNSAQGIATLTIPNASTGVKFVTLSSNRALVTYSNVVTEDLPASNTAVAGLNTIVRTPLNGLDFNWDHSTLQRVINTTPGFTFESQITFDAATTNRTLVFGFSGATVDTINDICRFNIDNKIVTGFAGAKIIMLVTFSATTIDIALYNESVNNATSAILDQTQITQTLNSQTAKLWIAYANTDATTESISIGINTDTYKAPIYTWNNSQKKSGSLFAKNNFKKIALSSWATGVSYSAINLSSYEAPIDKTPPAVTTPANTTPNALSRGLKDPLIYDWTLTKTATNPTGTLSAENGGYVTCLVKINGIDPSSGYATFMIGLSNNTTKTTGLQIDTQVGFVGADYNIQIQAVRSAATGFICVKRPNGANAPTEENPQEINELKKLITSASGTTTFNSYKLWLRYTPQKGFRYFDFGITEANDTSDVNTLTPLYSFVEGIDEANPLPPLNNISITTWGTSADITQIAATQNSAGAVADPGAADINRSLITYDGTLSSKNEPAESQWNQSATPPTCFQVDPYTVHQFAANGPSGSSIVLALKKNRASAPKCDYRFIITETDITLYENDTIVANNKTAPLIPLQVATADGKKSTTTPTLYWLKANNQTISLGGYEKNNGTTETPAYITYTNTALNDAVKWFLTSGATTKATFTYKSGTIIKQAGGSLAPTINRNGTRTVLPTANRPSRIASQVPPLTNKITPNGQQNRSSTSLDNQQYRRNTEMLAR